MKLLLLIPALLTCNTALASRVIITVTGTVSFCDADRFFPVPPVKAGDAWTLRAIYDYPSPPPNMNSEIYSFVSLLGRLEFETNGIFWTGSPLGSAAYREPSLHRASFYSSQTVPAVLSPSGAPSSTTTRFFGNNTMITDLTSLPDSFAKWNLPAAIVFDLNVGNRSESGSGGWDIRADHFDTISIQVIPEPSAAGLAGVGAIAALRRRRRVRA